jgi:competence protein ComGC
MSKKKFKKFNEDENGMAIVEALILLIIMIMVAIAITVISIIPNYSSTLNDLASEIASTIAKSSIAMCFTESNSPLEVKVGGGNINNSSSQTSQCGKYVQSITEGVLSAFTNSTGQATAIVNGCFPVLNPIQPGFSNVNATTNGYVLVDISPNNVLQNFNETYNDGLIIGSSNGNRSEVALPGIVHVQVSCEVTVGSILGYKPGPNGIIDANGFESPFLNFGWVVNGYGTAEIDPNS